MAAVVAIGRMATMRPAPTVTTVRAFTIDRASTSADTSLDHEDGVGADTDGVGEAGGGVDGAVGSRRSLSPSPSDPCRCGTGRRRRPAIGDALSPLSASLVATRNHMEAAASLWPQTIK
jgi:hypothetical protein